jgi:hypothetical protein
MALTAELDRRLLEGANHRNGLAVVSEDGGLTFGGSSGDLGDARLCNQGHVRHRFHDAVLVATAQAYGHGLLSKRVTVFGAWTKVALASP